ncbi:MAG: hypothetical protein II843_01435 [Alphaproteobacteria bacterium]|nr:hypothetical protein [Alphaproteobacteria bacterium]
MSNQKNICCRVFKEQFELIRQLPESERGYVLYQALNNAFNQFENQNDNQFEIQNESAYISVSISELGKCILNLLNKNIVCKEFSSNYGGARTGAGRKSGNQIEIQNEKKQTFDELIGQIGKPAKQSILIDSNFSCSKFDVFKTYINEMPLEVIQSVENWLKKQKNGQTVPVGFITKQFINFANRQNKPLFKA